MKNLISFSLLAICSLSLISCPKRNINPSVSTCDDKEHVAIWNGTVNTDWYKDLSNEFYICSAEELAGFAKLVNNGNRFGSKTVKLGSNIMLNDTANWKNWEKEPPKNKWVPIGDSSSNGFSGNFDGGGFAINGVYVNDSAKDYRGLFGYVKNIIGSSKTIKNLNVTASYIKGKNFVGGLVGLSEGNIVDSYSGVIAVGEYYVGGLVGRNYGGAISNSHSSSIVKGKGSIGGLIGNNEVMMGIGSSNISDCYSTGFVNGERYVGGLIGMNSVSYVTNSYSTSIVEGKGSVGGLIGYSTQGKIIKNYSIGKVTGDSLVGGFVGDNLYNIISDSYSSGEAEGQNHVGGFVGRNFMGSTISNSYSIGEARGDSLVGGFVGYNWSSIDNSYAKSTVKGKTWTGGFAGLSIGTIANSYSTGMVTATEGYIGGFAGVNDNDRISKSYYDKETSGQDSGLGTGEGEVEGKTTNEMIKKETFVDWDFDGIWSIAATVNNGYPYLRENPPSD